MSDGGRCVKHDNWHAHCQQCCREKNDDIRAQRDELAAALREIARVKRGGIEANDSDEEWIAFWSRRAASYEAQASAALAKVVKP